MQREIKFRILLTDDDGKKFWKYLILPECMYGENYYAKDEFCGFSQSMGKTDKNGKEIYEGDILVNNENYEPYKCVIEWNTELGSCGCCYSSCQSVGFVGRILKGSNYTYSNLASDYGNMEIIGDIYLNPELLK